MSWESTTINLCGIFSGLVNSFVHLTTEWPLSGVDWSFLSLNRGGSDVQIPHICLFALLISNTPKIAFAVLGWHGWPGYEDISWV